MEFFLLALLWSFWCALHSFMISRFAVSALKKRFKDRYRYYRVFFNIASVLTLIPVLRYSASLASDPFFSWSGPWRAVQIVLAVSSLTLFYAGARHYDLRQFLGIRQVVEHEARKGLSETGGLDMSGILGMIRHPWYAAGILILWARPVDLAVLVTNTVLTSYLFIGAVLEERKLVAEFGQEYREYQERVPMFFPGRRKNRGKVNG